MSQDEENWGRVWGQAPPEELVGKTPHIREKRRGEEEEKRRRWGTNQRWRAAFPKVKGDETA